MRVHFRSRVWTLVVSWIHASLVRHRVTGQKVFLYSIDCKPGAALQKPEDPVPRGLPRIDCRGGCVYVTSFQTNPCAFRDITAEKNTRFTGRNQFPLQGAGIRVFEPVEGTADSMYLTECYPPGTCPSCILYKPNTCILKIWDPQDLTLHYQAPCNYAEQVACRVTCPNGHYAKEYSPRSPINQLFSKIPECVPCAAGTFNTCVLDPECTWSVPAKGSTLVGNEIQQIFPPAVGKCFPCAQAKNYLYHYIFSNDTKKNVTINPGLAVWCEGGAHPPRNCPNEFYTHSPDYSTCVCRDTFYDPDGPMGPRGCEPCPVGHQCEGGVKRPCPLHMYQDLAGQSACKRCSSTGTDAGIYSGCPNKHQLQWCEPGSTAQTCVPCSRCKRAYVKEAGAEQVNCYRSS